MVKNLQPHGNSFALVLDKPVMELLGITSDTPLQITVSNGSLIVTPVNVNASKEDIASAITKLRPRYSGMLKNLAK